MNSESEILKAIWGNEGKSSVRLISKQTGLGLDYTHYLCSCLLKKGEIEKVEGKRDWFKIAFKGRKRIKHYQLGKDERRAKVIRGSPQPREEKLDLGRSIEKAVLFLKGRFKEEGS